MSKDKREIARNFGYFGTLKRPVMYQKPVGTSALAQAPFYRWCAAYRKHGEAGFGHSENRETRLKTFNTLNGSTNKK